MFDKELTKIECYLLGLIYADGYITGKKNNKYYLLGMGLAEKDKDFLQGILDIFNKELNKNYELRYKESTKSYEFIIGNVELCERLQQLGISPNKSYDNEDTIFQNIPYCYKKDFILGYWDGDGSFSKLNRGDKKNFASCVSNNQKFILSLRDYIDKELGQDFTIIHYPTQGDPYTRIRWTCNKAKIFGDWLYKDCVSCMLKRKYEEYLTFTFGEKSHYGFDNKRVKGVLCITSGKKYVTTKEAAIGEFGKDSLANAIASVARGDRKSCHQKSFRYLTEEEKEEWQRSYLNG